MIGMRTALAAMAVLALVGCGNRPGIQDELKATNTVFSAFRANLAKTKGTGPAHTSVITAGTPAEVRAAVAPLQGALNSVIIVNTNESAVLQDAGFNHGYRRWVSPTGQTLTTKSGVLTATRGLGFDLMSVDAEGTIALVRRQGTGNVNKVYRFLDGEDQEVERLAQCTVSPRGHETITLPTGAVRQAMKMRESCLMGRLTINNFFWVSGGEVVRSKQWASDEIGELLFQRLPR